MTPGTPEHPLPAKREKAIAALMICSTIVEAAAVVGVHPRTLRHWLDEDLAFQAAYRAARREAFDMAMASLQQAAGRAVAVLVEIMGDRGAAPAARVAAAREVLGRALDAANIDELATRLQRLEASYGTQETPPRLVPAAFGGPHRTV